VFVGSYQRQIDSKNRLSIPVEFRAELGQRFYMTLLPDKCLGLIPESSWDALLKDLSSPLRQTQNLRRFLRVFFARTQQVIPDTLGRITLNPALKDLAGINDTVWVIGNNSIVEVWDKDLYEQQMADVMANYAEIFERSLHGE